MAAIVVPRILLDGAYELDRHRPGDAAAHRRFSIDPDAARFFGWTVEQAAAAPESHYRAAVERFREEWLGGTRLSLIVRERESGEAVGAVELRPDGDVADVSYLVDAPFRGRGLAPLALEAMLAWGVRELGLGAARLGCHVDNGASRRVAEKCGFVLVGREGDELRFRRELSAAR